MPEHLLCPFLRFFMHLVVISGCQVLQFMWWTTLLIPTQDFLLILLQEEIVTSAGPRGTGSFQ